MIKLKKNIFNKLTNFLSLRFFLPKIDRLLNKMYFPNVYINVRWVLF